MLISLSNVSHSILGASDPLLVKFADGGNKKRNQTKWRDVSNYSNKD